MRLAWMMRRPDVDALVAELAPGQWTEWQAFMELYPVGPEMDDWRFARLAMILSQGKIAVKDLLHKPTWELARVKSAEEVIAQWEAFNARRKRK